MMHLKPGIIRLLGILLLLNFFYPHIYAQDTTRKYVVDSTKLKSPGASSAASSASMIPPGVGQCTITGKDPVETNTANYYFLSCSDGSVADYWEVSCGTVLEWYSDQIYIQWNTAGCTNATIKARRMDGSLLITKFITIKAAPLFGGCITSSNQFLIYGSTPATIIATGASGGTCAGSYKYQWQRSTDNNYFIDIPGATLDTLSFSAPLSQTTYFQRKTTCGPEIKFTGSVRLDVDLNCAVLQGLKNKYYDTYVNPSARIVVLDMRTFAGNKTLAAGPKGVFNINEKLLGNTVDGTLQEINNSFVQIWNSDAENAAVGTLSALSDGRFSLQLNPGKEAPCKGVLGQRFYQYDLRLKDTTHWFGMSGEGTVVDFGDSSRVLVTYNNTGSDVAYSDAKTTVYQKKTTVLFLENLTYMPNYTPVKYLESVHIYAKPAGVRKTYTVTFYHTDLKGLVDFREDHSGGDSIVLSRNLRGYFPQQTLGISFYSTQDSTICRTREIKNFKEITSIQRFIIQNRGAGAILHINLESFSKNKNLQYLLFVPGYQNEDSTTLASRVGNPFHTIFPNLNSNFPNIGVFSLAGLVYREKELDSNSFEMPRLKHLDLAGQRVKAYQIDRILNQIAQVNTQDSGTAFYNYFLPSEQPTSQSATSYQTLKKRGWNFWGIGTDPQLSYSSPRPVDNDPLFNTNAFTEYMNLQLGTKLTYEQVQNLFLTKCGYTVDACNLRPLN